MKKMYTSRKISPSRSRMLPGYMKTLAACLLLAGYTAGVNAQNPAFEWAVNMGSADFDQSLDIQADRSGNTYTTGFYNGATASFGAATLTSGGGSDGFLAKCDAGGSFLWARNLGGSSTEQGTKIAVDDKGNVYVAGGFSSSDFSPDGTTQTFAATAWNSVFVVKYDAGGNFRWVKTMGGSDGDFCRGIAVDGNGNVYLTGLYNSTDFSFGSSSNILPPAVSGDGYVMKLDSNGSFVWAINIGGTDGDDATAITVDSRNNIYVAGFFNGSADFNPNGTAMLTAAGVSDAFLAKYDSAGNYIWARRMGGPDDDYGISVAAAADGHVYITGHINGNVTFDGTSLTLATAGGSRDPFLAGYDTAGAFLWARNMGGPGFDEGYGVAVDGGNNVYVTGGFNDTANFSSGPARLTSAGSGDVFVAKYGPGGNYIWAKNMGGTGFDRGNGVAVSGNGSVYVTGYFLSDPANFNLGGVNGVLSPLAGSADGFIVKLGCGNPTSARIAVAACGESYSLNGTVYTASGTYTQVIPNTNGCDSTITLTLTLNAIDTPLITVNGNELGVTQTYDAYQWMDENGDIPGATDPTFTVTANGEYSVRVTDDNGCEAVSGVYEVTNVSVDDVSALARQIRVHPNPVHDIVYVSSPVPVDLHISSLEGRTLLQAADARAVAVGSLAHGIYLLRITDKNGRLIRTEKMLKQ